MADPPPGRLARDHDDENRGPATLDRSGLLRGALVGATGLLLGGALTRSGLASAAAARRGREDAQGDAGAGRKVLIAYFSRPGETYSATVARNVREQNADARPRIANRLNSIDDYDVVLLGSPIWNVRPPMIMSTFVESFEFSGRTIHPFVTYAVSGLGATMETYAALSTGARISAGLAVRGETVRQAEPQVTAWLRRINLLR
jgi:flavodoxin